MAELKTFNKALPLEVINLLDFFNAEGFKAGVVGGIPRDYLNEMRIGDDFDVELRPAVESEFFKRFESLQKKLKERGISAREKGFKVFEVLLDNASVEFTLPRIEVFNDSVHHSNFEARHIADRDYSHGFLRRDFTVNAIMFERWEGEWKLIDPLSGVSDLKARLLRACDTQNFVKDPVRFLRALRFSLKLDLTFEHTLQTLLENMELSVSSHYLKTEAQKSLRPLTFLLECHRLRPAYFPYGCLEKYEDVTRRYENEFTLGKLKNHISEALFLPAKVRSQILEAFGLRQKGLIELDLKEVNLGKIRSLTLRELAFTSWAGPFLSFLSKASEIEEKKLDWILKEEGAEFDYRFIESYKGLSVRPDDDTSKELKNIQVLKKKIMALSAK